MSIGKRLQECLNKNGLTAYELSNNTGISKATLSRILNTDSKPNIKNTKILSEYFQVSRKWLLTGDIENWREVEKDTDNFTVGDAFELEYIENNNANSFINLENGQYLMTMPLAEYDIQAGLLDIYQDIEQLKGLGKHSIIVDKPAKGRYIAFRVKGDSMDNGKTNGITEKSIVTSRELQRHLWKDKIRFKDFPIWVIYTTQSRMPLLKQIISHDVESGTIKCHSLNDGPEYTDFELSLNDIQALFYVIDVNRPISKYDEY